MGMVGQVKQSLGAHTEVGVPQQALHLRPHGLVVGCRKNSDCFPPDLG